MLVYINYTMSGNIANIHKTSYEVTKGHGVGIGTTDEIFIFIYKVEQTITYEQNFYKNFFNNILITS